MHTHPRFLPAIQLVVLIVCCLAAAGFSQAAPPAPGQLLVQFRPGTPAGEIARAHAAVGASLAAEIPQLGVQVMGIPPGLPVGKAIGWYRQHPRVVFAEPDLGVAPALTPNDPYFNYGQLQLQWMGGPAAWDITTGSAAVPIAVVDTGADFRHPDLQGRLAAGWDFVEGDGDPADSNGHGTMVAGVLGAATNNGLGVAAVCWRNPVLVVRIGDATGWTTWSRMAQGIVYAADHGARAINVSYAGSGYSSTVAQAVAYAWNRGAVVVAAAGNGATSTPQYPAAMPQAVAVSGVDGDNVLVYYSNYGSWIDVSAPCNSQTTWLGGGFNLAGGTSIAAPFVTGLLGLVFAAGPGLSPQQAVEVICETADDLGEPGFDSFYGWGKINLYQAVAAAQGGGGDHTPPVVSITAPAPGSTVSGTVTVSASATDNVGVSRVELWIDGTQVGALAAPPYQWGWNTVGTANGTHTLSARAYDAAGNLGTSAGVAVTVSNPAPPSTVTETFSGAVGFRNGPVTSRHTCAVAAGGTLAARLSWGGKADLDLALYSPAGTLVASAASRARGAPEQISVPVTAGSYTLAVTAASGKASYTLTVTHP